LIDVNKQIKKALEQVVEPFSSTNQSAQSSSVQESCIKKMTDNNTLADYNFKDFGKLMRGQVSCYQYPIGINSEPIGFCCDMICLECGNNHSFRGNFEDAITSKVDKRNGCSAINKLQEFVNYLASD
jgi:hypothetical protein